TAMETEPGVLFDALALPLGPAAVERLNHNGQVAEYIQNQYRHCKPILAFEPAVALLEGAGAFPRLPDGEPDPGIVVGNGEDAIAAFIEALAKRRHFERESDPPRV